MKMIIAILNSDDAPIVTSRLMKNGYSVTKLSSTGGFLRAGNVTIMVGVDEEKVQAVIDVIATYSKSRKQIIPTASETGVNFYPSMPVEVTVGGATIFVLDVEQFMKV